ncbi:MAG: MotA/TolQ/ExbB proton channel family protein [Deltaproteobacteria bacterium]|nr:MotA/TolQ/ExbB proton channel family protein [Deltaproteobacteria bacterium]
MNRLLSLALEQYRAGGMIMVVLALVSVWMWTLVFFKAVQLAGWKAREQSLEEALADNVCSNTLAGWQKSMLDGYSRARTGDPKLDCRIMEGIVRSLAHGAERHVRTIVLLASIAPLLGLLGTVGGMIEAFETIARWGTGNAQALSAGISTALTTTQAGLVVAIPGLFMGRFLQRRAQQMGDRLERFSAAVLTGESGRIRSLV